MELNRIAKALRWQIPLALSAGAMAIPSLAASAPMKAAAEQVKARVSTPVSRANPAPATGALDAVLKLDKRQRLPRFLVKNQVSGHGHALDSGVTATGLDTEATLLLTSGICTASSACSSNGAPCSSPADCGTPPADFTPPWVTNIVVSGSPAPTAASVSFNVNFSETANNVSTDDFQLTTTGTASGTISSVSSSSGSTITVTVSSISGTGTIRLDLKSNTNIVDNSGNGNNNNGYTPAYSSGSTHTVDRDAPSFQNSTPSLSGTTLTQTTLAVRLNEIGTAYYVVVAGGSGAPSSTQVKNGQDSAGGAALKNGSISVPSAGVDYTTTITGLNSGTAYDIYVVAEDDEATPNVQSSPILVNLTTASPDSDGTLISSGIVTEPVGLDTTKDTAGEATDLFDFTIYDQGTSDGLNLLISQIVVHVSGTSTDTERSDVTWRLNGPDAANVTGTYNSVSDTITFSGLSINIADGGAEIYTVNGYYNTNTGLSEDHTFILSVDGDTDVSTDPNGTQMGVTSAVTNGSGTTIDVVATQLGFTTQPAGSVSGTALTTQPVVAATDAFGNTDVDFITNISLSEASAGTLSGTTSLAPTAGVATFTNIAYTASADQEAFTLSASATGLTDGTANSVTADVVATKLAFTTEPAPTTITSGANTAFSTVPVVKALDANNTVDTGYASDIVLSVTDPNDGIVDGTVDSLTGTGDNDGSGTTVTLTPSSGSATFSNLALQYTAGGAADAIALKATSGGLIAANSTTITTGLPPVVTDANISISGATGTGGAFRLGDTITATWDNTASGDNNAGITGVTVDFTQFGGGPAVAASNSAGIWTASITIVAGGIDATNRNVSVSATSAGGTATTADTTNATVDNTAPTVTDAKISVSGATGAGGAFILGDTVTVTWNNTVTGDNNSDTIGNVTVDFSALGGGSAVPASNSAGTWTATYTVTSGSTTGSNLNVSVTATDNAGNTTTTADTSNLTIDNSGPAVTNVTSTTANGTYAAAAVIAIQVQFDDNVTVTGTPQLTLETGSTDRAADYSAGSGTNTLTFTYTVQAGDTSADLDYVNTTALALNGGTIKDANGNPATLTLAAPGAANSLGANKAIVIDTGGPTLAEVTPVATRTKQTRPTYTFSTSEAGTLSLGGSCGTSSSPSIASAGNVTITLTKTDNASALTDGTYSNCTVTVTDNTNNASNPLAIRSFTVDTVAPSAPSALALDPASDTGTSATDRITADTTPTLTGTSEANASISVSSDIGGTLGTTTADANGNWSFTPSAALSEGTHNLTATATDQAGNQGATSAPLQIVVDATAPSLDSSTPANGAVDVATTTDLSFHFNEAITAGSGNVSVHSTANGALIESVAIDSTQASINDATLTVSLQTALTPGAGYYVLVDNGALKDVAGNTYSGIASTSGLQFTVAGTLNTGPVANADSYSLNEGGLLTVNAATGVLGNDSVPGNSSYTATIVTAPSHAEDFSLNADGSFSYRHDGSETTTDSFTYELTNGTDTSNTATVSLSVTPVNDPPAFTTTPTQTTVTQGEVFSYNVGVSDPDSTPQLSLISAPAWLHLNGQILSGTAPSDATGAQTVQLRVSDSQYSVDQSFSLSVVAPESPQISLSGTWKDLPATTEKPLRLSVSVTQSSGQPVSNAILRTHLRGVTNDASMSACTLSATQQFDCPLLLSAGNSQSFELTTTPHQNGDLVAELSVLDSSSAKLASAVTDTSVATSQVSQPNTNFDLGQATALASIDLNGTGTKTLLAGTGLGSTLKLLDYDNVHATITGEINNTGYTRALVVGDVNKDGRPDVVVLNSDGETTNVYYNQGGGQLAANTSNVAMAYGREAILRDLDNDGYPELIVSGAGFEVNIYQNHAGLFDQAPYVFTTPASVVHFALLKRLPSSSPISGTLVLSSSEAVYLVRFGLGAGVTSGSSPQKAAAAATSMTTLSQLDIANVTAVQVGDLNGDGQEEVVLGNGYQDGSASQTGITITSVQNDTLTAVTTLGNASTRQLNIVDLNNDGIADLLVNKDSGALQIYRGTGALENWLLQPEIIADDAALVLPDDLNGDGIPDILLYKNDDTTLSFYLSDDSGKLGATVSLNLSATASVVDNAQRRFAYRPVVHNVGSVAAQGVRVSVSVPTGITVISLPDGCSQDGSQLVCNLGELAAGATQTLELVLQGGADIDSKTLETVLSSDAREATPDDNQVQFKTTGLFATTEPEPEHHGGGGSPAWWLLLVAFGGGLLRRWRPRG